MVSNDPIERAALKLTRAQCEVMTAKMHRWEVSPVKSTAKVLVRLGMIEPAKDHEFFETYRFTSYGRKVRALLLERKYGPKEEIEEWVWESRSKNCLKVGDLVKLKDGSDSGYVTKVNGENVTVDMVYNIYRSYPYTEFEKLESA